MTANKPVYLDHAATSPLLPEARDAMLDVMNQLVDERIGNASALHSAGVRGADILEDARLKVARLIGADPAEIIFTSGGSEANNTVMHIFQGQKVAISAIEHPSVLNSAKQYASEVTPLPVNRDGVVTADSLLDLLDSKDHRLGRAPLSVSEEQAIERRSLPSLLSIMFANNELGTIQDIATLVKAAHSAGVTFHTDATQAVGKIPIDVHALGIDYLTFTAHKLGGPVGIGVLYVRKDAKFQNLIYGGHQESGRRAGTSNVMLAAGFAAAAEHATKHLDAWPRVAKLRDSLRERILSEIPGSSCNSPSGSSCLPNLLNMSFAAAEGESIQLYLDASGHILVGTGSACASGSLDPSHVLMATRHDAEVAHSSIRFSFGLENTPADVDRVMSVLPGIIKRLQGISTISSGEHHGR